MVGWWRLGIWNLWVKGWLLGWVILVYEDIDNEVDYGRWDEVVDYSFSPETSRLSKIDLFVLFLSSLRSIYDNSCLSTGPIKVSRMQFCSFLCELKNKYAWVIFDAWNTKYIILFVQNMIGLIQKCRLWHV